MFKKMYNRIAGILETAIPEKYSIAVFVIAIPATVICTIANIVWIVQKVLQG